MQFQKKLKGKFVISKNLGLSFKASWIPLIGCGFVLGVISQHIQTFSAYTDTVIKKIEVETTSAPHFQPNGETGYQPAMNQPRSFFRIDRSGYALAYDASRRNPQWVYEHLTTDSIQGNANRSHANFKEDDNIPPHLRATLVDYRGCGFDRGHMAPAADHRSSERALCHTFFMTNMCPQCPELNRGYWSKLEKHVRDLTQQYNNMRK
ncbi:DNA/RNA non-specific endonuclease [Candidatus Protochlamydia naegleriophila]|uniref:DNA/RNA non-specific endonuclease n=1 Tax=Candidatus Protochlamydia naegleriophila TaxID=389348 RepID=UPI00073E16E1|nr:DNA/RNA non-specific endonuclease [Candidatus Protochlamydia naegleriophila]